jgi:hypothetical protein
MWGAADFYRPVQRLSYLADYAMWDLFPRGFHLTSIYLHAAAAVLLFFLAEKLGSRSGVERRARLVAGALVIAWTVLPVARAFVSYIAAGQIRSRRALPWRAFCAGEKHARAGGAKLWATGALTCFLGAALSKESGLAMLVAWLALLLGGASRGGSFWGGPPAQWAYCSCMVPCDSRPPRRRV